MCEKFLRNDDGSLIITNEKLENEWGNYFDKLLNYEETDEAFCFNQEPENNQL